MWTNGGSLQAIGSAGENETDECFGRSIRGGPANEHA